MPKRVVDVMQNEIMRGVRLTGKNLEYISFNVPRKTGAFSADLYPEARSGTSSLNFEEYWSGQDKEPLRQEMKPSSHASENVSNKRKATFMAKIAGNKDVETF
jgi:coronin-1B/1C/6